MNLSKVIMAVTGILIVSESAQGLNVPSIGFIKRGFKSCTNTCTEDACKSETDRKWCQDKCSHKLNMNQICYKIDHEQLSPKEMQLIDQLNGKDQKINPDPNNPDKAPSANPK